MDWHQDVALYVEPQYELVFTLENTSDSQTQWQDADGRRRGVDGAQLHHHGQARASCQGDPRARRGEEHRQVRVHHHLDKTEEYYDNLLTYE